MTRDDSPVWMIVCVDGVETAAQQVWAKTAERMLGDPEEASRGLSKLAWLNALKISVRNCSLNRSFKLKTLIRPMSAFQKLGAVKALRGPPFWPGSGIAKSLASGKSTGPRTPGLSCNSALRSGSR